MLQKITNQFTKLTAQIHLHWLAVKMSWQIDRVGILLKLLRTLIEAPVPLLQAWVGKLIIDKIVFYSTLPKPTLATIQPLLFLILAEFGLFLLSFVLNLLFRKRETQLENNISLYTKSLFLKKIVRLNLSIFDDTKTQDLIYQVSSDAERGITSSLWIIVKQFKMFFNFSSFFIIIAQVNPLMALIICLTIIPNFIATTKKDKKRTKILDETTEERRLIWALESLLIQAKAAKELRSLNLGNYFIQDYQQKTKSNQDLMIKLDKDRNSHNLFWATLTQLCYYFVYGWIILLTVQRTITLGDMTLYLTFFKQIQNTLLEFFLNISDFYLTSLRLEKLFNFLKLSQPPELAKNFTPSLNVPKVEFKNVYFKYHDSNSKWVLADLSFVIEPGKKLAIVGENGAGKTTIINLVAGLYLPTAGEVLIDNKPTSQMSREELKDKIGVIFQDFVHYQATLKDNIGLGDLQASEEEIIKAAQLSGADDVIAKMPLGIHQPLGQSFNQAQELSGGQWQKIALARAFIQKGKVLVLDEPTAALDAKAESAIFDRFQSLTVGKTTILVSHRFSSVKTADMILVIEQGKIVEQGSHKELIARAGIYQQLFNLQAKAYLD